MNDFDLKRATAELDPDQRSAVRNAFAQLEQRLEAERARAELLHDALKLKVASPPYIGSGAGAALVAGYFALARVAELFYWVRGSSTAIDQLKPRVRSVVEQLLHNCANIRLHDGAAGLWPLLELARQVVELERAGEVLP